MSVSICFNFVSSILVLMYPSLRSRVRRPRRRRVPPRRAGPGPHHGDGEGSREAAAGVDEVAGRGGRRRKVRLRMRQTQ